jgi:hypothetical protein
MGIRFFCPNGHRLHVKSFLAGKRGVCPDCGTGVMIPMESDARALASKTKGTAEVSGNGQHVDAPQGGVGTAVIDPPEADISPATFPLPAAPSPLPSAAAPAFSAPTPAPVVHAAPVQSGPVSVAPAAHVPGNTTVIASLVEPAVSPAPVPGPTPMAAAPIVATPVVAAAPVASGAPVATPVAAVIDPISQNPNAIWYVRPTSGGQYGPARGDVFRQWIGEGRVTPESLVWREDWPDWRTASKVFPNLAAAAAAAASGPAASLPSAPRRPLRPARKPSSAAGVGIVIGLGLVCFVLFVALIYVLMNTGTTPPATP